MWDLLAKWGKFPPIAIQTVHSFATWKYHCLKANGITQLYITHSNNYTYSETSSLLLRNWFICLCIIIREDSAAFKWYNIINVANM